MSFWDKSEISVVKYVHLNTWDHDKVRFLKQYFFDFIQALERVCLVANIYFTKEN